MNILQALILAIIEGFTEFLPISSTGHMTLATHLMAIPETEFVKSFMIIIQIGAIAAIAVVYYKKILTDFPTWKKVITAFIPQAVLGLALYKFIKSQLIGNAIVVVVSLIVGGIILILFEKIVSKKILEQKEIIDLGYKKSAYIGLFQAISMIPGVSRSAATIIGGVLQGLSRKSAVEFSFFLAIPTMAAATLLDLAKIGFSFDSSQYMILSVGTIGSFLTGLLAIKGFLKYVQNHSLAIFGYYRIVIGLLYLFLIIL